MRTLARNGAISTSSQPQPKQRLDSWKEIAAFFERDERTVRRWETERGLPVHRVPGNARGVVYAFTAELEEWLRRPQAQPSETTKSDPKESSPNGECPLRRETDKLPEGMPSHTDRIRRHAHLLPWVFAGTLSLAVFLGVYSYRQTARFGAHAAGSGAAVPSAAHHVPTPEAQDLYLKGRFAWNQRTPESLNQAVDYFTQAIVHDPSYAQAYIGLADCYNLLREFSVMQPNEAYPRAIAAAQKAIELDPDSAEAHTSLAFALFWGNIDVQGAEREFQRALALAPKNTRAHHWYATFLVELARFPEALAEIERARQLDPTSTAIMADKGFILMMAGQTDQAFSLLKQVVAADPSFSEAHRYLSSLALRRKDYRVYFEEARIANRLQHDAAAQTVVAAEEKGYAAAGYRGLLLARLVADRQLYDQGRALDFTLASDYSALGDKPQALKCLDAAYQKHDLQLTQLLVNTDLQVLHEEPAFRQLVAKVGLPPLP